MTIPSNTDRRQPKLTAFDLQWYARLEKKIRTEPYSVTGTEAADAIANLLFHVNQLLATDTTEARHARHA